MAVRPRLLYWIAHGPSSVTKELARTLWLNGPCFFLRQDHRGDLRVLANHPLSVPPGRHCQADRGLKIDWFERQY